MSFELLHESESVYLVGNEQRKYTDLHNVLRCLGFSLHGDVFSLDRTDQIPPWQHDAIAEVHVLRYGVEIYDEDGWDCLILDYLFASLPETCVPVFIDVVFKVANALKLQPRVGLNLIDRVWLEQRFAACSSDLMAEYAEVAGSEELAILIAESYPRKR